VGKTTIAAVLGPRGRARGKRVLVMTIDPARSAWPTRWAPALDHEAREVPREAPARAGRAEAAAWPRSCSTRSGRSDELVLRLTPDPAAREPHLRECHLSQPDRTPSPAAASTRRRRSSCRSNRGAYDLVVLDTRQPRTRSTFSTRRGRLSGFLDGQVLKAPAAPRRGGGAREPGLFRSGSELVLRVLERVTDSSFWTAISEFLLASSSCSRASASARAKSRACCAIRAAASCWCRAGPAAGGGERARSGSGSKPKHSARRLVLNRVHRGRETHRRRDDPAQCGAPSAG